MHYHWTWWEVFTAGRDKFMTKRGLVSIIHCITTILESVLPISMWTKSFHTKLLWASFFIVASDTTSLTCSLRYVDAIWFVFHVQLLPEHKKICMTKPELHKRSYDKASARNWIGNWISLNQLWLLALHVSWFFNWKHGSSQLCSKHMSLWCMFLIFT